MMAFKEVICKICTDDYNNNNNNEYLFVKYIRFLLTILHDVCNVMCFNEQKQFHENEAIIPT